MNSTTRALKPAEASILRSIVSPLTHAVRWLIFFVIVGPLAFLKYNILFTLMGSFGVMIWLLGVVLLCFWLSGKFRNWSGGGKYRGAIRIDLKEGVACEESHEFHRGIVFPEKEDEGCSYFLEDLNGGIYYFAGQELPRRFPKRNVVVSVAPLSRYLFKITTDGPPCLVQSAPREIFHFSAICKLVSDEVYVKLDCGFDMLLKEIFTGHPEG